MREMMEIQLLTGIVHCRETLLLLIPRIALLRVVGNESGGTRLAVVGQRTGRI
jgi:hypothetical protein